jgi:hypothetical protein
MEKADYSNLNRRPDRMPVYGAGLRRKLRRDPSFHAPQRPRNSHCTPTPTENSD